MATKVSDLAGSYLTKADNAISSMTGAAQTGALAGGAAAVTAANEAGAKADEAAETLKGTASTMTGIADTLLPVADRIASDAGTLRKSSAESTAFAQDWLKQSKGLLAMDETTGGVAGEFAALYKKLDPDLQVAMAASDARGESQAQGDAAVRALQRAGVSPTAAALASIRSKVAASTSAVVAAAKTKARQAGISLQMDALEKGLTMAIQQAGVGEKFLRDAAADTISASQAEQAGATVRQGAASIYGASGSLVSDAQQLIQAAASGKITANSTLMSGYTALVNSFATAAEYYSTQASSMQGLVQEGQGATLI